MNSPNKVSISILLVIFSLGSLYAQETKVIRDLQLWTSAAVKKDWGKKFATSAEFEYRLKEDISRTDEYFIEVNGEYNLLKSFEIQLAYRFIWNKKKDLTTETEYRWHTDVTYIKDIKRLGASLRIRYQNRDNRFFLHRFDGPSTHILRNRLKFEYDIPRSKIEPAISAELFYSLHQERIHPFELQLTIGSTLRTRKWGNIRGFYRIERELNNEVPYVNYIIGLKYRFKL